MPIIIAIAIRYVILAAVQLGLWSLVEKFGLPLLNKAVVELMKVFGVDEETAKAIMANKIVKAFEEVGIFAVTLRTKMPIKVAEYLGFTSKGYAVRKVAQAVETKVIAAEAGIIGSKLEKGVKTLSVLAALGVGNQMYSNIINTFDFGTWSSSAYQSTFQKIFSFFGLEPDKTAVRSDVLSDDMWAKVFGVYQNLGAVGISDPNDPVDLLFTKVNLKKVVDKVAANMIKEGTKPTLQLVIAATQAFIRMKGEVTDDMVERVFPTNKSTNSTTKSQAVNTPTTKVFVGVVSQGNVGGGLSFTPRPDDIIESLDELRHAAANNLAPFLAALPAKVIYEVKVVASITTKDGFKQSGTTQKIQTGTFSNGTPKYKIVTNKFATLILYILTDKGTRTKLATIVLGPVDSARLVVGENDLRALETALPAQVTTTNISEISSINTTSPIIVNGTAIEPEPVVAPVVYTGGDTGFRFYKYEINKEIYYDVLPWLGNIPAGNTLITKQEFLDGEKKLRANDPTRWNPYFDQIHKVRANAFIDGNSGYIIKDNVPYFSAPASVSGTAPAVSGNGVYQYEKSDVPGGRELIYYPPGMTPNKSLALPPATLSEWYQTQGQALPSVSERSKLYESMGLGQASYYTGTSEQNAKLLAALKGSPNVSSFIAPTFNSSIDGNAFRVS